MAKKKLDPAKRKFVNTYLKNGFNGTQAYLAVSPMVSRETAATMANKYLNLPEVQNEIEKVQDREFADSVASREYLIKEAHDIGLEARVEKKLNTALQAVEVKGRLNKVFDKENQDMGGYEDLLRTLVVVQGDVNIGGGVNGSTGNGTVEPDYIDITPDEAA